MPRSQSKAKRTRWKKILAWATGGLVTLILIIVVGAVALLHSAKFHVYLLRTAQQKASEALGSQIQMRDFAFHWSGLGPGVELYGVVVHGAAPYENPPLLQADSLRVQVTITSFLHRSWYVDDIRIEHPVVRVFADNQGHTNIPSSKPKSFVPVNFWSRSSLVRPKSSRSRCGWRSFLLRMGFVLAIR